VITSTRDQVDRGFQLNLERGLVRKVHYELFPPDVFRSLMVGFSEDVYSIVSRVPPRGNGPAAHWHDVDQLFFCLTGELELTIGQQTHRLRPGTLAIIPAGTNHVHRNLGAVEEIHLELIVPGIIPARPIIHPVQEAPNTWTGRGTVVSADEGSVRQIAESVSALLTGSASPSADLPWQCAMLSVDCDRPTTLPTTSGSQSWFVMEGVIRVDDAQDASKDCMILTTGPTRPTLTVPAGVRTRAFALWPEGGLYGE
jgi:quercetin dioxygenase-like cupin family protein